MQISKSQRKINSILEIMEILLGDKDKALELLKTTSTYKAIIECDNATLYQSAACCVEDIGRELSTNYSEVFSNTNINKALDTLITKNTMLHNKY